MSSILFILFIFFSMTIANRLDQNQINGGPDLDLNHWAKSALNFIKNMTCSDTLLTTEEDCNRLVSVPQHDMNFYFAEPSYEGRLVSVLPDGPLDRAKTHDAVMVLDPYPAANLGHVLVTFFVDISLSQAECALYEGHYLGNNECLTLALRKRCHNLVVETLWKRQSMNLQTHIKRCEVNFFPMVHIAGQTPTPASQRLKCRDDVRGFASCPTLRPKNKTDDIMCDPLQMNTRGCSSSLPTIPIKCGRYTRCDHAVLISGGWDRLTDNPKYMENVLSMHEMLSRNGFLEENIKIFYSNGYNQLDDQTYRIYPAAFKGIMRSHIRKMCRSQHCADSLVIYLNSPAHTDGTSLLWDVDGNGQADRFEVYTIKELLHDTRNCHAEQVYMIADQSYAGKLIHQLEKSSKHRNVLAFASGRDDEYAWNGEFTSNWVQLSHEGICMKKAEKVIEELMTSSHPVSYDASYGAINKTIFGGKCDGTTDDSAFFQC